MIPPEQSAAFVADMERVLDVYAEPYDPRRPVVCLSTSGRARSSARAAPRSRCGRAPTPKQDHEYTRGGLCCAFLAFEPLAGWRRAWVRPQRRRLEFAEVVRELCDEVYPDASVVRVVCDTPNTHSAAAFYERYPPEEARRLAERVEFVYTPVHGSWLNVVECEFSAMVRGVHRSPPVRADRRAPPRGRGVGGGPERGRCDRRVALHHGRRAGQAEPALPVTTIQPQH